MDNRGVATAGCGACELCGEVDPCANCSGVNLNAELHNGLLAKASRMLAETMTLFEPKEVVNLNHKVCEEIQAEQDSTK